MTDKLYYVDTQVHEYSDCKDVPFTWFNWAPEHQRPYAKLIEGYDPKKWAIHYAEAYVDELFTEDEAKQLKAYLDREHGDAGVTTIREVQLPAPNNRAGVGSMAVGGGDDFHMLFERQDYSLPFKAAAYFDLRNCQLIDGSDVYHERLLLLFEDGGMRMQTNEEAAAILGRLN
jgi:hypothetical protein